jgi:hypothetical protein
MHADRSARRDESSHTTMPSRNVLFIRAHSRTSAVMLFGEFLNQPAIPRIETNARRLLFAGHLNAEGTSLSVHHRGLHQCATC